MCHVLSQRHGTVQSCTVAMSVNATVFCRCTVTSDVDEEAALSRRCDINGSGQQLNDSVDSHFIIQHEIQDQAEANQPVFDNSQITLSTR